MKFVKMLEEQRELSGNSREHENTNGTGQKDLSKL